MTEVATAEGEKKKKVEVGACSYILYYLVLFFAHWFGAARFDFDGDGDFDPEDVAAYLEDKTFLKQNFRRSTSTLSKASEGKTSPAAGQAARGGASGGMFDQNGDGEVDIMDAFETQIEGETAAEDMMIKPQRPPVFIITECILAFGLWAVFALKETAESGNTFIVVKAGLDSLAPNQLDLRLHDDTCADYRGEVWRWWTYQFTHVGAMHILMNCFLNVMLGIPLEGLHGSLKLALMYNVGVIGGAFCFFFNDSHTAVVGMSGGCYALIGIHIATLIMNWKQMKFRKPILVFLFLLVGTDLASYFLALGAENASHSAHMGGAIAGGIMGVLIGTNIDVTWQERVIQGVALFVGLVLTTFSVVWLATQWPPHNIYGGEGWCWVKQVWWYPLENFVCVRCGLQACIDEWTTRACPSPDDCNMGPVNFETCVQQGFYNE